MPTTRHALPILATWLTFALVACGGSNPAGPEARPVWTSPERATGVSPAAYRDGVFYVIVDVDGRAVLRAQSESTGAVVWTTTNIANAARFRFSDRGDEIRLGLNDSTCVALDLKTGAARTNVAAPACGIPRQEAEPGFANETDVRVVPDTEQRSVAGLGVKDGTALWKASIALDDRAVFAQPPAIPELPVRNGIAPLVTLSYRDNPNQGYLNVQAFDAVTGVLRWRIDGKPSPTGRYVVSDDGNGNAILIVSFSDETPAAGKTLTYVLAAYALADGAERWRLPWPAARDFRVENGVLFGCASGGSMAWLDPVTGRSLGETRGTAANCNISNPNRSRLAPNAQVFIRGRTNNASCFACGEEDLWVETADLESGRPLWRTRVWPYPLLKGAGLSVAAIGRQTVLLNTPDGLEAYQIR
ncbi:MAG: PQQ-binding-like beta-propeller repeat protein [Thermoflexales bacterium]